MAMTPRSARLTGRSRTWRARRVRRRAFRFIAATQPHFRPIPADTVHLINVIPLDRTYSPYSFQPLNIVADPNLPQLDPELRSAAEERGKQVLSDGVAAVHATGRAAVAHLIVERTWESVSHAVCAKANELDAAALVVANSGKNWVRGPACICHTDAGGA